MIKAKGSTIYPKGLKVRDCMQEDEAYGRMELGKRGREILDAQEG